ncbi:hypothetical protein C8T65DRAFT_626093 [Cerioporus squamosus]|nr:hypothetical protein C8T65DRAFT_626093 [Cerioporus squamosus]
MIVMLHSLRFDQSIILGLLSLVACMLPLPWDARFARDIPLQSTRSQLGRRLVPTGGGSGGQYSAGLPDPCCYQRQPSSLSIRALIFGVLTV